ncbi:MAG TPA: alanine racemase [Acidimicrobiales bacterium]|nr:alanine racemase [Acidimicrobiales bacterium]
MAELTPGSVARGLEEVRSRIGDAGGDPEKVRIVAVTKGFGPEAVTSAAAAGCRDIGENYAQQLLAKADVLAAAEARVHFLGMVQRNKVGRLAPHVHLWHSVDRAEVGESIARVSPGAEVLVQVDLLEGAVAGRGGVALAAVPGLVVELRAKGLEVRGLMAVGPPPPADPEPGFRRVVATAGELDLPEVSIGMSGDLEAAVRAGSTMIRIGRALFGERPKP